MLVLLFVVLWFILRGDLFYVLPCVILFLFFFLSPFSIAITSLGEERANLSAFRTFVRFVLVWICRFPLPLSVWEGPFFTFVFRLVSQGSLCFGIVTFPGSLYLIYILLLPATFLTLRINVTYSFINTIHYSV